MAHTVFITGTSSGLGKRAALYFAEQGWNVAATMRDTARGNELAQHDRIHVIELDVTDASQARRAAHEAIEVFGGIDVVVNNAGVGAYGPLEFASEETIDWQFAVNVRGPINVIRAFLPHMRAQKRGKIINISSFMGVTTAVPTGSLYNMSKFALEGLIEGLYYELAPLSIDLHLVESGGFKDNSFASNMTFSTDPTINDYDRIVDKVQALFASSDPNLRDDPQLIVDEIYALATGANKQFRTLVGQMSKDLVALRSSVPIEDYLAKLAAQFS
ncbi:SDR family NAD(P)-dependent oxidoreductase [Paraburkholderia jirisanensis]